MKYTWSFYILVLLFVCKPCFRFVYKLLLAHKEQLMTAFLNNSSSSKTFNNP